MDALFSLADLKSILIALFLTVSGTSIIRILQPSSKVVWSTTHGFNFHVPVLDPDNPEKYLPNKASYFTQTIFVQNTGKGTAEDVELIFNYKPEHFQIWPITPYKEEIHKDNRFSLRVEHLSPRENFSVELLGTHELPRLLRIRTQSKEGMEILMSPSQVYSRWIHILVAALMFSGAFLIVYLIVKFFTLAIT